MHLLDSSVYVLLVAVVHTVTRISSASSSFSSHRHIGLLRSPAISVEVFLFTVFLCGRSKTFVLAVKSLPLDLDAAANLFCTLCVYSAVGGIVNYSFVM